MSATFSLTSKYFPRDPPNLSSFLVTWIFVVLCLSLCCAVLTGYHKLGNVYTVKSVWLTQFWRLGSPHLRTPSGEGLLCHNMEKPSHGREWARVGKSRQEGAEVSFLRKALS